MTKSLEDWELIERSCLHPSRLCWGVRKDDEASVESNNKHETLCGEMRDWARVFFKRENPHSIRDVNCPICKNIAGT